MLTGRQIRQARDLLGWSRVDLSLKTFLRLDAIEQAEDGDGSASLVYGYDLIIQRAFEAAGVLFLAENGEGPGVRLRKVET